MAKTRLHAHLETFGISDAVIQIKQNENISMYAQSRPSIEILVPVTNDTLDERRLLCRKVMGTIEGYRQWGIRLDRMYLHYAYDAAVFAVPEQPVSMSVAFHHFADGPCTNSCHWGDSGSLSRVHFPQLKHDIPDAKDVRIVIRNNMDTGNGNGPWRLECTPKKGVRSDVLMTKLMMMYG